MGRLRRYRTALRRYQHSKGFGIHSPFAFRFVLTVLRERCPYYCYEQLNEFRHLAIVRTRHHLRHPRIISLKNAKLIFRVTNYFNPPHILQIGTSYGVSSAGVLSVSSKSNLVLYEPRFGDYPVAHEILSKYEPRMSIHADVAESIAEYKTRLAENGSLAKTCPIDTVVASETAAPFVLVNNIADDIEQNVVAEYLNEVLCTRGVIIMRNLSRSNRMKSLWLKCKANAKYGMTFSNEKLAVIVISEKLQRQDFSMWF